MKKTTWIIVANSVEAQIYNVEKKTAILLQTLSHEKSRLKSSKLVSDKPGHYKTGHISGGGQFSPSCDPQQEEKWHFAKEVAGFLEGNRQKNQYDELIVCADPNFQGLLNKAMNDQVHSYIKKSIEKNYIPLPKQELNAAIENMLQLPSY